MSTPMLAELQKLRPDLVVGDVLTAAGGLSAERLGVPWVQLCTIRCTCPGARHRSTRGVAGLPTAGDGCPVDRRGEQQRSAARLSVGMGEHDPGPTARLVATLPALEVPRPDWPANCHVVGPLLWDPADTELAPPPSEQPLVIVSPSTAVGGTLGMLDAALSGLAGVRVAATVLQGPDAGSALPSWAFLLSWCRAAATSGSWPTAPSARVAR